MARVLHGGVDGSTPIRRSEVGEDRCGAGRKTGPRSPRKRQSDVRGSRLVVAADRRSMARSPRRIWTMEDGVQPVLSLVFEITEGQRHDSRPASALIQRAMSRRLLADKAY